MNSNLVVKIVILGLISISFPTYILYQYFQNVSNGNFSHLNSDWGNFGSLLSGSFTLLSSIATLATLGFIIYQHNKNLTHQLSVMAQQDVENKIRLLQYTKDQEHQEKVFLQQEALVQEQKSIIKFQKYQTHKQLFEDLLKGIESRHANKITFYDTAALYQNIFPNNGFEQCTYRLDLEGQDEGSSVNEFLYIIKSLKNNLDYPVSTYDIEKIIDSFLRLFLDKMHISYTKDSVQKLQNGDVYLVKNKSLIINLFKMESSFYLAQSVAKSLIEFTGNEFNIQINHLVTSFVHEAVLKSIFHNPRLNNTFYSIHLDIEGLKELAEISQLCQQNQHRSKYLDDCNLYYMQFCEWYSNLFENLTSSGGKLDAIALAINAVDKMKQSTLPPTQWQQNHKIRLE
ncbi:hypothetical protein, partial [Shewanella sp. Bg11-22]